MCVKAVVGQVSMSDFRDANPDFQKACLEFAQSYKAVYGSAAK